MSLTASAPFSPGDSDMTVAYISIFILIGFVVLFPLGGYRFVVRDFTGDDEDDGPAPISKRPRALDDVDVESCNVPTCTEEKAQEDLRDLSRSTGSHIPLDEASVMDGPQDTSTPVKSDLLPTSTDTSPPSPEANSLTIKRALMSAWAFLVSFAIPPTISIILAMIVAVVPVLKDGLPPLHVIFDTATFIGGGSIPLRLICLGSALARLEVPKLLGAAPLGPIASFSILKMIVGPVFGVILVEALTHNTSLISPDDKVLRFVCIYLAGSPTLQRK
ncbi:auxin efflux carrier transmembrane protein [Ceratobasidium sp. AG-Ba]|nr:auxin efflux carrier transmembrane protein [Ceratobasidium sp. AG-Ba]